VRPELIATYRLQLCPGFGFDEARALIPYLKRLGVSHVYTSPYLQAAAGSNHGYDVVDPTRVNEELGGAEARERFVHALAEAGLGHVIDVVPNHMAIIAQENPWWWDVLENGPASRYATYFDVDWASSEERWPNKVLLPVLGDHYGRVLEAGELQLVREGARIVLRYWEHVFPLDPASLADLFSRAAARARSQALGELADGCEMLPQPRAPRREEVQQRHHDKAQLGALLGHICEREPGAVAAIDVEIEAINADVDCLDALLEHQNFRLAFWRSATLDLGYRRFFDIHDLAGLSVEDPEVFAATHALPLRWVAEGSVQGLRIDHPDGLRNPTQYFRRLREAAPEAWIVAEKILEPEEPLREDWPIAGTTGYDFLAMAGGLLVHAEGEGPLTNLFHDLAPESVSFAALVRETKRQVLTELLGSEINRLTALFVAVCERHRRHRDYSRRVLAEALRELAVAFPVYRSYVSDLDRTVSEDDARWIEKAVADTAAARPDLDPELLVFLRDLLLLRVEGELEAELAMRFQQLTGPAMAKGVEDTAFYRDHRLVALNEVGGRPDHFGASVAEFHAFCAEAATKRPLAMLTTSTHDTKRSEDLRARLALLSEIPDTWARAVRDWTRLLERHRPESLDHATMYLFYQTVVGAWPIDTERMVTYLEKAAREAKLRTSWRRPDAAYETELRDFATAALADEEFIAGVEDFVGVLREPGRVNSLSQTLLKLTAPGVPDLYQGTELWNLSLVDPDNRRPVDFARRARLLASLDGLSCEEVLAGMDDGLPKLWLIQRALHLRRERPRAFGPEGGYHPLEVSSRRAEHVVAFVRGGEVATVVPRLLLRLEGDWHDTAVALPEGRWRNVLTGETLDGGSRPVTELLARFPVALLAREEDS
jgi:(1->4)-alpha-D-glucan 1-alpha-D-glucosylmutase